MLSQKGMTVVELVVICCIAGVLLAIVIPKFSEANAKNKMWDGMTTLMTYESAELAFLAQNNRLGPTDSLIFHADTSEYFEFTSEGRGCYQATTKAEIGRFKKGSWLHTCIDTVGGLPRIHRTCSTGDSAIVKRLIPNFFN